MELIELTYENIDKEHICCAISNNKDIQIMSKKNWLKDRLDEGLVFLKGNVRGKCFIEYIPAEYAWTPIWAEGYIHRLPVGIRAVQGAWILEPSAGCLYLQQ